MKKFIFICLFALLLTPNVSSAQTVTNEQLLAQINSLMQIVLSLLEQVKAIEAKSQVASPVQATSQTSNEVALGSATSAPVVDIPVTFSAVKVPQTVYTRCIDPSSNDGISMTVGSFKISPNNSPKSLSVKAKVDITGAKGDKSLLQVFNGGNMEMSVPVSSAGAIDLNLPITGREFYFWIKEVKKPTGVKLTIESATIDGKEVSGLPMYFEPVGLIACQ